MLALALSLLISTASADAKSCVDCCQQSGLISCPTQIRVFGDGSLATPESGGWRVIGIWWLECGGSARFEPGGTVVIDHQPRPGEVLRLAYPADTVRCYGAHCALPRGACMVVHDQGDNFAIATCDGMQPLTSVQMHTPGVPQVQLSADDTPPVDILKSDAPLHSTRTPVAVHSLEARTIEVAIDLPAPPGATCSVSDLLKAQSRRQQEEGDQARIESRHQEASDRYQAALSMDPCNAFAWHAIGQLAIQGGQLDAAIQSLRVATRLLPGHYGAFTSLGEAYERNDRPELAYEAYRMALTIHPQHPPALQGVARIKASR